MGIITRTICATTVLASTVGLSLVSFGANQEPEKLSFHVASVSSRRSADGRNWIKARVLVHAPRDVVWNSVSDARTRDPDLIHSRILEKGECQAIVEEKMRLPLIGSDVYVVRITQKPCERMDYKLLKSRHMKAYEGNWQVSPGDLAGSSVLQLEHHTRPAFFVPGILFDSFVARRVERRIMTVKRFAELNESTKDKESVR
jgi:hypothetical protein